MSPDIRLDRPLTAWLLANRSHSLWLAALIALALGGLASGLVNRLRGNDLSAALSAQVDTRAAALQVATLSGQSIGVARLLGLAEPALKSAVSGNAPPNDGAALEPLRTAQAMLDAKDLFVMNASGDVVLHVGPSTFFTGKNFAFRPYFERTMAGKATIYAELDPVSRQHGLFFAVPLRADATKSSTIIGVVVIEVSGDLLDHLLANTVKRVFLISPQGLIFAGSERSWVGSPMLPPVANLALSDSAAGADNGDPPPVRFSYQPGERTLLINGERHYLAIAPLDWQDPAGDWRLVMTAKATTVAPFAQRLTTGAAVALMMFLLLWLVLRLFGSRQERAQALAAQQVAVAELAAASEAKALLADIILKSQEALTLQDLARVFFDLLRQGYPLHQGTLYLAERTTAPNGTPPLHPDQADQAIGPTRLRLIGHYAAAAAPELIAMGEGLLGECAQQGRALAFDQPPEGFWRIGSGLGETHPRRLDLLPLQRQQRLLGVLELASLEWPEPSARALLDGLVPLLAMQLEVMLNTTQRASPLAVKATEATTAPTPAPDHPTTPALSR
ncbi:GAF domain-containing protein [Thiorhodovibrio frisius]|uniref:GAF domain-containing protein n=1 Tax=Thiorhodovibrio frisius TaxID=631362 RepID=H8Z2M4_9GAMM|nr:GAF domain-containing protein [Thiorhodovibrio frisius]EIC22717.1 hypothetical protein Thi970DRAFT_02997 [Thiorhodovibrio frisius]WPL22474.1 putative periplasmic ligand-binding sensor domain protein [Thiorhodovibrio frisius]